MNQQVMDILNTIEPELWWFLIKMFIALLAALTLKQIMENIVSYLMLRMNKRLGVGVEIIFEGRKCMMKDYNLSWIFLKTLEDTEIIVPITRWKYYRWEVIDKIHKNGDKEEDDE